MSRLGKLPINLPNGTEAKIDKGFIVVKGPKGELKEKLHDLVSVELSEKEISVKVKNTDSKKEKSFWGLYRSLINNMVVGVAEGFEKKLEIIGVGYRAAASGNRLDINAGYSHPVIFELPEGISAAVEKNVITISGSDKQLVGETAARIRKIRKPEPYKGKGIKYADEVIVRKEGKAAGKDK
jgi:large subunit ribosomal protein L6